MNKYGLFSFLMFVISVILFFIIRGPNANLDIGIVLFSVLSIIGIIFSVMSKKWLPFVIGATLNGGVLVFAFFLLLARGIGGP